VRVLSANGPGWTRLDAISAEGLDTYHAERHPVGARVQHNTRPVLLNLDKPGGFDITPCAARVQLVDGSHAGGVWELPVLGEVTAPTAVLIRPDGHVAWVGDLTDPGLPDALTTWFGPPTPA